MTADVLVLFVVQQSEGHAHCDTLGSLQKPDTRTSAHVEVYLWYASEFVLRYVQLGQFVQMLAALLNRSAGKHLTLGLPALHQ